MSIPLDQLYHYIDQCARKSYKDRVIIYRFYPNGSKEIKDLSFLDDYTVEDIILYPQIFCYDQEPLDFDRYEKETYHDSETLAVVKQFTDNKMNLRDYPENAWDHAILLHSEQRSRDVKKYQHSAFVPVYYWSHAVIARDWFRFAKHTEFCKQIKKIFLIYNRAWSGTREYRLKFSEYLIRLDLVKNCQTTVNPIEPELKIHYELHKFKNSIWRPTQVIEKHLPISDAHSHYSATFNVEDYNSTDIEVVLETLFDDDRLHLTEKSLRPIACGQPFIIAGTYGSLEYLRRYGFKTFGHIWDERYDQTEDPEERLIRIADLMKQIANWSPETREQKMSRARAIAEYNRQHFFSDAFLQQVIDELQTNLDIAFVQLVTENTSQAWLESQERRYSAISQVNKSTIKGLSQTDWDHIVNQVQKQILKHGT